MKEVVKDEWDAIYIDKIGDNRQQLYDVILVGKPQETRFSCSMVGRELYGRQESLAPRLRQGRQSDQGPAARGWSASHCINPFVFVILSVGVGAEDQGNPHGWHQEARRGKGRVLKQRLLGHRGLVRRSQQ